MVTHSEEGGLSFSFGFQTQMMAVETRARYVPSSWCSDVVYGVRSRLMDSSRFSSPCFSRSSPNNSIVLIHNTLPESINERSVISLSRPLKCSIERDSETKSLSDSHINLSTTLQRTCFCYRDSCVVNGLSFNSCFPATPVSSNLPFPN